MGAAKILDFWFSNMVNAASGFTKNILKYCIRFYFKKAFCAIKI